MAVLGDAQPSAVRGQFHDMERFKFSTQPLELASSWLEEAAESILSMPFQCFGVRTHRSV